MVRPDGRREPFGFISCEAKDNSAAFGFDAHHTLKRPTPCAGLREPEPERLTRSEAKLLGFVDHLAPQGQ